MASTNFFSAIFSSFPRGRILVCRKAGRRAGTGFGGIFITKGRHTFSHPTRDRNPAVPPFLMHHNRSPAGRFVMDILFSYRYRRCYAVFSYRTPRRVPDLPPENLSAPLAGSGRRDSLSDGFLSVLILFFVTSDFDFSESYALCQPVAGIFRRRASPMAIIRNAKGRFSTWEKLSIL